MRKKMKFAVIGGDLRMAYLAAELAKEGHEVCCFGTLPLSRTEGETVVSESLSKAMEGSDCVVLPLPVTRDREQLFALNAEKKILLSEIMDCLQPGQRLLGGSVLPMMVNEAERIGVRLYDYFEREEMTVLNALITAEGALQIAMEELPITLHGSRCLITGNGRISKLLSRMLYALGAKVTIAARKPADLAWGEAAGCHTVPLKELARDMEDCDVLFNTVPVPILGEGQLRLLKPDCLIVELASPPGGLEKEAVERLKLKVIWAKSLPGKVAPKTAARIIQKTILTILEEDQACHR